MDLGEAAVIDEAAVIHGLRFSFNMFEILKK